MRCVIEIRRRAEGVEEILFLIVMKSGGEGHHDLAKLDYNNWRNSKRK